MSYIVISELLLIVCVGVSYIIGVNLYDAEKPLATDDVEVRVRSRSTRDVTSTSMAEYYDVTLDFGGKNVNARLKRHDLISGLVGQRRVYKKDWATYASDEVDGVFVVHRHESGRSSLNIEGFLMHDRTPYLLQPHETSGGHVIHKLAHRANSTDDKTLSVFRSIDVSLRFGSTQVIFYIQQYYAMLVTFIDRRFESLRRFGTNIYFNGLALDLQTEPIPGVVEAARASANSERKSTCATTLKEKFVSLSQYDGFDQVILLTGYVMLGARGFAEDGFGTLNNGCLQPGARSFVQFTPRVEHFRVAAQAVMKGFGVKYDGERGDPLAEACPSRDYYIMAPEVRTPFSTANINRWRWWLYSICTNNMLRRYLQNLSQDRWRTCLSERTPYETPRQNFLGKTMTPHQQCRLFDGPRSYAVLTGGNICGAGLTCRMPINQKSLTPFVESKFLPLPGTICGPNKWCDERECVLRNAGK